MPAHCRSCGADIRFVTTEAGATMPINLKPDPEGNVIPIPADPPSSGEPRAHVLHKNETPPEDTPRFMPHHATCPHADQHRKRS